MILQIYSVYDTKVASFGTPFFVNHEAVAIRSIANAVNDPSVEFHRHHADFMLFHMGEFSTDSAEFNLLVSPKNLGPLTQYKEQQS